MQYAPSRNTKRRPSSFLCGVGLVKVGWLVVFRLAPVTTRSPEKHDNGYFSLIHAPSQFNCFYKSTRSAVVTVWRRHSISEDIYLFCCLRPQVSVLALLCGENSVFRFFLSCNKGLSSCYLALPHCHSHCCRRASLYCRETIPRNGHLRKPFRSPKAAFVTRAVMVPVNLIINIGCESYDDSNQLLNSEQSHSTGV